MQGVLECMRVLRMTRVYEGMRLQMYVNVPGCVSEPVHSRTLGHTLHTIVYFFKVFFKTNFHFKFT
jgi:hypothetical protein